MYVKSVDSHILMCCKNLLDAIEHEDYELAQVYLKHLQRITSVRRATSSRLAAVEEASRVA